MGNVEINGEVEIIFNYPSFATSRSQLMVRHSELVSESVGEIEMLK